MTKEFEIVEIRLEEGVDLGSSFKDSLPPMYSGVIGENSFIV